MIVTSVHLYSTRISALTRNQPESSEAIYTGGLNGAIYVKTKGRWIRSRMTPDESVKQKDENIRDSKSSCRYLRDEMVNGVPAGVYAIHSENEDSKSDGTIWVAKGKGLPMRDEIDINSGDADSKMHVSTRYDYSNVRPPDGVQ